MFLFYIYINQQRKTYFCCNTQERMQRRETNDENRGICCRLIRYVVVKLMAGQKEDKSAKKKLIKKGSNSDITIHYKEREDNAANAINTRSRAERERVIMLVNGSDVKSVASEASFVRPHAEVVARPEDVRKRTQPKPVSIDIDKKSDAFIQSRLEMMRKRL
ncbi:hypothetical protein Bca52824_008077 [Brassica carinata]|uniref:Uncharacterized protein n=1 Tax=Brassica carinata TaxID=52824 RepID=A0A8X7W7F5_BRACI|nr:hypothetical protein Bca52824_008077 [Brassica carinata]